VGLNSILLKKTKNIFIDNQQITVTIAWQSATSMFNIFF